MADPRVAEYRWTGGWEAMLRYGPETGPVAVVALPLLEEANRTRAFATTLLRALAERGIAGALPDLPGQGDSLVPLADLSVLRIQEGYQGAIDAIGAQGRRCYAVGLRSGTLLDALGLVFGRWQLSPQDGRDLLNEWRRIRQAAGERAGGEHWWFNGSLPDDAPDPPVAIAGNLVSTDLLTDLIVREPWSSQDGGPIRVVRLTGDPRPADRYVEGTPLWRRSEPGNDPALAALLADDIAAWIERCEG